MSRRDKILGLRTGHPVVLPSMLLCDFGNLEREVARLESAGFKALHLDVMDGVFVENFSYGLSIVQAFRRVTDLPLDVHLMMTHPQDFVTAFFDAGADLITFHIEAVDDAPAVASKIQQLGAAVGVAIDRDTPVSAIQDVAALCDLVLVMTIKAGFGGQEFMPALLSKLQEIREIAGDQPILQVDGGVNDQTISKCIEAGAEWMVVGSGIFRNTDYRAAHDGLISQMCANGK